MKLTRRGVLAGAALGGGLLVAWTLAPRDYASPLGDEPGETAFDAWLKIGDDGVVTVAVPQLEMGQGITTLLPQIVAQELGADWRLVAVQPAPVSGAYVNLPLAARWAPLWRPLVPALAQDQDDMLVRRWARANRFTATADGMSLPAYELPCRQAAAAARQMLCEVAAERWGVEAGACDTAAGFVVHGDKSLSFAELAAEAGEFDLPDAPLLRAEPPSENSPGQIVAADEALAFPRLDLPSKVDGSYQFAGDVRLPGMVYAAIRHGPQNRSELTGFEVGKAAGIKGLVGVVRGKRWLAAAAESWWSAERALTAMEPQFSTEHVVNSLRMREALDDALERGQGLIVATSGTGVADYRPTLALRYDVAPAVHASVETASVTARLEGGRLELWMASQAPEQARRAAAKAIGIDHSDVVLYPMPAGGSFDRRLEHDHAIEVALIAREIGRPVQLVWSREEEALAAPPRPPSAGLLAAELTQGGRIHRLRTRIATPSAAREFGRRLFDNRTSWAAIAEADGEADAMAVEGGLPPYALDGASLEHVPVSLPLPSGRMRANAHAATCFMIESFVDEVAKQGEFEPMGFRIAMLGSDPRLAQCLQRAARLAEWDGGVGGSGQGMACHRLGRAEDESAGRIAVIATARAGEGGVRVTRLDVAVDIGRVINRDIALQQIEGGLVFGLALALGAASEYADGGPVSARLAELNLPGLDDMPEIQVDLIESDAAPFDPGEIGVPAVAPAIANALHSATGLRLRRLPLLTGGL